MNDLQVLAEHRADLLLAEVAALLHDAGKCTSEFAYYIQARSVKVKISRKRVDLDSYKAIFTASELDKYQFSQQRIQERKEEANQQYALHTLLGDQVRATLDSKFTVENTSYSFREAIYFSRPKFATRISAPLGRNGEPLDLLANCHGEGHVEKEDPLPSITAKTIARYSAFGYLLDNLPAPDQSESLTERLNNLNWQAIIQHNLQALRNLFLDALGDTRFPINEVTLWDWSYTVASLYKTELARHYLTSEWRTRKQLHWRLLRVNFDVLALYAKAVKIGDLLGYQRVVDEACAKVKQLVEEEYPLGNEIYRDSTGIYFTFPDLDLLANLAQEIRRRVESVDMELAPHIAVVQGDGNTASAQLKGILGKARGKALDDLAQPFDTQILSDHWEKEWAGALAQMDNKGKWETCPVCGLRPKREERDACQSCEKRRKGRVKEWLETLERKKPSQPTIWTNEVADQNGRLALIVGKFDLTNWLSGDLVQTMLVKTVENAPDQCVPKNPSPARLRRAWETTQRFWESALKDEHGAPVIPDIPHRLVLEGNLPPSVSLNPGQTYDLLVHGFKLSVVWDGARFLVCDNPAYFKETTKEDLQNVLVLKDGSNFILRTSEGYKKQDREIGRFTPSKVDQHPTPYAPFIPILREPQVFMAIVPADKALDVARAINSKYACEMGKVRNRLPLHLGLVFAGRRIPLQAILDAGRAMLTIPTEKLNNETWCVEKVDPTPSLPDELKKGTKQFDETPITLTLKNSAGRTLTWHVPTVMGDGKTPDQWYPYVFLKTDGEPNHPHRFQAPNPWTESDGWLVHAGDLAKGDNQAPNPRTESKGWLVHAGDLKEGDKIYFTPATFDFEYLDSTARRFDIYYDKQGRRPRPTRPYYLDDLDRLEDVWNAFSKLSRTQLKQIIQTIETARERWFGDDHDRRSLIYGVFRQFVADTLTNAGLLSLRGRRPKQSPSAQQEIASPPAAARNDRQDLITAAQRGELADLAELHLEILKEKMKGETA